MAAQAVASASHGNSHSVVSKQIEAARKRAAAQAAQAREIRVAAQERKKSERRSSCEKRAPGLQISSVTSLLPKDSSSLDGDDSELVDSLPVIPQIMDDAVRTRSHLNRLHAPRLHAPPLHAPALSSGRRRPARTSLSLSDLISTGDRFPAPPRPYALAT